MCDLSEKVFRNIERIIAEYDRYFEELEREKKSGDE